jgi:ABC-type polysaccharide/polyol phosphate export permease
VIAVWMFATSVVYPIGRVGGRLGAVLALNPMTHLIDAFRAVLLERRAPDPAFVVTVAVALVLFVGSWIAFHRAEFDFAENL